MSTKNIIEGVVASLIASLLIYFFVLAYEKITDNASSSGYPSARSTEQVEDKQPAPPTTSNEEPWFYLEGFDHPVFTFVKAYACILVFLIAVFLSVFTFFIDIAIFLYTNVSEWPYTGGVWDWAWSDVINQWFWQSSSPGVAILSLVLILSWYLSIRLRNRSNKPDWLS